MQFENTVPSITSYETVKGDAEALYWRKLVIVYMATSGKSKLMAAAVT